ncbi:flavin reductase family protein [Nitrosophilus kaiyonis]|uniref:flavin reductase family protein n=1 Tax=Nitrosophilus kaiyonis TaxID=2930200 RepID=UPI00248FC1B3|nr:flavin reductase family protein [Nitrosophilus kaiyonis]
MIVDFENISFSDRYKIMSHSIIPRPIAWIVTENETLNIAPFSYFSALSSNPATLIVSIGHKKDGSLKDTLKNILQTKKCTISLVSPDLLEKMHLSSKELPYNVSEADVFDIKTEKIFKEFPPMIKDSPASFFCNFYQKIDLDDSKTIPVILEIKKYFVNDKFVSDPQKYYIELELIARVGKEYALCNKKIEPPKIT